MLPSLEKIKKEYSNLDVLHVCHDMMLGSSMYKEIVNCVKNINGIRQNKIFITPNDPKSTLRSLKIINKFRPKILHIHFWSIQYEQFFYLIRYKPYIVSTIHSCEKTIYDKFFDMKICIHVKGYDANEEPKILIENSVDIDSKYIKQSVPDETHGLLCCRFRPNTMLNEHISIYGSVHCPIYIIGFVSSKYAQMLKKTSEKYNNINILPWSDHVYSDIASSSFFPYIHARQSLDICYGLNIMEAACLGVPCITAPARHQNFQKYIVDGYNGFASSNQKDFVNKINILVDDLAVLKEFKKNALLHASTLKNDMPDKYKKIYQEALR